MCVVCIYIYIDMYTDIKKQLDAGPQYIQQALVDCCTHKPRAMLTLPTTIINMITCTSSCAAYNTSFRAALPYQK